jgi:hypothetical protein
MAIFSSLKNLLSNAWLTNVEGDSVLLLVGRTGTRESFTGDLPQLSGQLLTSAEWHL